MKKLVTVNLVIVFVLLLVIETAGQIFFHQKKQQWLFMNLFSPKVMELHPWLVGWMKPNQSVSFGNVRITSTDQHTRWTGAPANVDKSFRIALIGGSTTFSTGVTDKESWPALLQARLGDGYAVYNYGIAGYSTAENIIQMALQVPEIKPDMVIFYEGWNDIRHYHYPDFSPDYYAHGIKQYRNLQIDMGDDARTPWMWRMASYSAIFKFIVRMKNGSTSSRLTLYDTPDPEVDRIYLRNIKTLKLLSEQAGAKPLFVPQVLNTAMYLGKTGSGELDPKWVNPDESDGWWTPYIRNSAMPELMDHFNGLVENFCHREKCEVAQEVSEVDWQPDDFVDRGHFTKKGGEKFVDIIEKRVRLAQQRIN